MDNGFLEVSGVFEVLAEMREGQILNFHSP